MLKPPHPEASKCLLSIFIRVIWHPNRDLNPGCSNDDADPGQQDPLWLQYSNTHRLQKSCGGKGAAWPLCQEESTRPLPWQAFIAFLGPLHQRWSSFIMHRFVLGGYLLQTTKDMMSLNTSKKDICNVKGEMIETGYVPYLEGLAQILGR